MDLQKLADLCSNSGRWGASDDLGTLNFITPQKVLEAMALVRLGQVIPLGKVATGRLSGQAPPSFSRQEMPRETDSYSVEEVMSFNPHGFELTHLDALSHVSLNGILYNERLADVLEEDFEIPLGSMLSTSKGIMTRGVLLDVAAARGLDKLPSGVGITVTDLLQAEELAGQRVGTGDAVVVRSGYDMAAEGNCATGVLPEVVEWLHSREVAVFAGDVIEQLPSGDPLMPMPLHQIGLARMGLSLLDCLDVECLAAACREFGTNEFLLSVAPLRLLGATASPVNPLAVF